MTQRANPLTNAPEMRGGLITFGTAVASAGLEPTLVEREKLRASQSSG